MSLTQTLTTPKNLQSISLNLQEGPPLRPFLLNLNEKELINMAVDRLQSATVQIVEWGAPLFSRMRVPIVIRHWAYLVPDDVLETASNILSDMGLPLMPPPELLVESNGDFYAKARLHRITRSTYMSSIQYLQLLPLSFPSFSPSELTSVIPLTSPISRQSHSILHPTQPAVYTSIMRTMLVYPRYCATRTVLESNLSELIGYNLYDVQIGYVNLDNEALCEELELDRRVDDALHVVKGWGWDGAWREGEEWMGDALAAVVAGPGDIGWLPWAP